MLLATLVVGLALSLAAQDDPRTIPTPLYPSHQNNALVETTNLDNGISALERSAPAHQNSEQEMLDKVAAQTSPAGELGWNPASTICAIALLLMVLSIFSFRRRFGNQERVTSREVAPRQLRRVA